MNYDAIIVGSGQGGNPLAFRLADLGWSVALIEKKDLGGTCINVGCTPTKTMVHRAQVAHYARNAARWGVNASNVSVDLARIVGAPTFASIAAMPALSARISLRLAMICSKAKRFSLIPVAARAFRRSLAWRRCRISPTNP